MGIALPIVDEHFEEKTKGITFYHFVCEIEKNWQSVKEETLKMLKQAYAYLANRQRITVGLTVDEEAVDSVMQIVDASLNQLKAEKIDPLNRQFVLTDEKEALIYPSNVNYVAAGYNFKDKGYAYHGGLLMLKTILSMNYLWTNVRVKNGAYGCFCDFRKSGNMFFVSYRDPNLDETLAIYNAAAEYVAHIELSDRELLQYLIGTISTLDFPFTPASEGKTAQIYALMGITEAELQESRDELFETDNKVLQGFSKMLKDCLDEKMYCVFGNAQAIQNAKTIFELVTNV